MSTGRCSRSQELFEGARRLMPGTGMAHTEQDIDRTVEAADRAMAAACARLD